MIVIAIIGILAAIALPAYSSYLKKAKFTEVSQLVESVKTPIALCIQEYGVNAAKDHCKSGQEGFGWEIKAKGDYKSKYVTSIEVTAAAGTEGQANNDLITITATADSTVFGSAYTLVLKGSWTAAGQLDWKVDSSSTCTGAKLCKADTAASTAASGS